MDQPIRNKLRNVVTQCRKLLEDSISQQLQGKFGIHSSGKKDEVTVEKLDRMSHLTDEELQARQDLLAHFEHITALGSKAREALEQLIREVAFTHLNRLCAYKMMEVRDVYVGGQKFREAVSKGLKSQGFLFYLAEHPDDEQRCNAGKQEEAYRHFLNWLGGTLSQEIGVLFSPTDPANRVYPPQRVLDEVLDLLNSEELKGIWSEDETIGWVYQYFTPKELRDQVRKESQAPRNSYELAFRNQFFTPRYVVEFLTDNTLGRIWYEMRHGMTRLKDECRYMVRRLDEVFLADLSEDGNGGSEPSPDLAFLLGKTVDLPPFELPEPTVHPAVVKKPNVFEMGWAECHDAGARLWTFAHAVRSFGWGDDPRMPELRQRLEDWNRGERDEPVDGTTQDLWDLLFAVHRAARFGSGAVASCLIAATRIANEIRRRLLVTKSPDVTQEERLRAPVLIPHRAKKDPRQIKILDPACGSGHFLLYCFSLLLVIYEEAYDDPELGPALQADYPSKDEIRRAAPGLILRHNLHGIDIDLRCTQIAALALWLRCQRAYQDMGLKKDRPIITRSNIVCAEPMPGEGDMLKEFIGQIEPKLLGQMVEVVFDKMKLAGEAGSLLKIEEDIREAVAEARRQWIAGPVSVQRRLFDDDKPVERQHRFDLSGVTDAEFFEQAEAKVVDALRSYSERAQNGQRLQRRLFTDDAERGFAFVEICHKRFSIVLMNPPFGENSNGPTKVYVDKTYPLGKHDLCTAFIERGYSLLSHGGQIGSITTRTGFFRKHLEGWRKKLVLAALKPSVFADLGYGVLDTAKVETAAYCLSRDESDTATTYLRVTSEPEKDSALASAVRNMALSNHVSNAYLVPTSVIETVPGAPFAYWATQRIRRVFSDNAPFECDSRAVRVGMQTSDDFRFLRCWWEVSPSTLLDCRNGPEWRRDPSAFQSWCRNRTHQGKRWVPFSKGGEYTPFFSGIKLVVNWERDGAELKEWADPLYGNSGWSRIIKSVDYYFLPGLTFLTRTSIRLCSVPLAAGSIFSHVSPCAFLPHHDLYSGLARLNSLSAESLLSLFHARGSDGDDQTKKYEVGQIQQLPWPRRVEPEVNILCHDVAAAISDILSADETGHSFESPIQCASITEFKFRTF